MNANELADVFDTYDEPHDWGKQAATMLRQQQAEIEAFKLQYYNTGYSLQLRDKDETIRQQQAEIEALKLQLHTTLTNRDLRTYDGKLDMNNEPVAWMLLRNESCVELTEWYGVMRNWEEFLGDNEKVVELYTHPAKTLTDEEIIESLAELEHDQWMSWANSIMKSEKISDNRFARWASLMIPYAELSEEMKEHDRVWAKKALAILRKAQEK